MGEANDAVGIDYAPCEYGSSRLTFRGPTVPLDRPYIAVIGGSETYGRFVRRPYAVILAERLGMPVVNLGCMNAGVQAFLDDPSVVEIASGAELTVFQVLGAANMSNRFYRVHPRRNDRFLGASDTLQRVFPGVDFTETHFTQHLLCSLEETDPGAFEMLREDLRITWVRRMRQLLRQIASPTLLLWMSERGLSARSDSAHDAQPMLVDGALIEEVRSDALDVVTTGVGSTRQGMVYADDRRRAANVLPDQPGHDNAAMALAAAMVPHLPLGTRVGPARAAGPFGDGRRRQSFSVSSGTAVNRSATRP